MIKLVLAVQEQKNRIKKLLTWKISSNLIFELLAEI
jgi:hypothetical protein